MARNVVPIRLDQAEQERLDKAAARAGLTRTAFIRQAALAMCADPAELGRPRDQERTRPGLTAKLCRHNLTNCRVCGPS